MIDLARNKTVRPFPIMFRIKPKEERVAGFSDLIDTFAKVLGAVHRSQRADDVRPVNLDY